MIQIQCGGCGKAYAVPDQYAGKKMRCKQCSQIISIPAPAASAEVPEIKTPAGEAPGGETAAPAQAERPAAPKFPQKKGFGAKKTFPSGAGKGIAKKGFASKKFGARKSGLGSALSKPSQARAGEEGEEGGAELAGEGAKQKKTLLLVGGGVLALIVIGVLVYIFVKSGETTPPVKKPLPKLAMEEQKPDAAKAAVAKELPGSAAKTSEKAAPKKPAAAPASLDALAIMPAGTNLIGHLAFGRLTNVPGIGDKIREAASSGKAAELFKKAGFDPLAHLSSVWLAADASANLVNRTRDLPAVVILEGAFQKDKCIEAMKSESLISSTPKKVDIYGTPADKNDDLEIYELRKEKSSEPAGYFTFLSEERALVGEEAFFNKIVNLLTSGGDDVTSNSIMRELSGNFGSGKNPLAWLAIALTQDLKDAVTGIGASGKRAGGSDEPSAAEETSAGDAEEKKTAEGTEETSAGEGEEQKTAEDAAEPAEGKESEEDAGEKAEKTPAKKAPSPAAGPAGGMPPAPELDGVFLSCDLTSDGAGVVLDLALNCSSKEDLQKAQGWAAMVPMLATMVPALPQELKSVLAGMKTTPDGSTLRLSLTLTEKALDKLKAMPFPMMGAAAPSEEAGEGEEGEEETEEAEAPAPDAAEGDMAEKEAAEKAGAEEEGGSTEDKSSDTEKPSKDEEAASGEKEE